MLNKLFNNSLEHPIFEELKLDMPSLACNYFFSCWLKIQKRIVVLLTEALVAAPKLQQKACLGKIICQELGKGDANDARQNLIKKLYPMQPKQITKLTPSIEKLFSSNHIEIENIYHLLAYEHLHCKILDYFSNQTHSRLSVNQCELLLNQKSQSKKRLMWLSASFDIDPESFDESLVDSVSSKWITLFNVIAHDLNNKLILMD